MSGRLVISRPRLIEREKVRESERRERKKERKISQLIGLPHFGLDFLSVCSADRRALLQ